MYTLRLLAQCSEHKYFADIVERVGCNFRKLLTSPPEKSTTKGNKNYVYEDLDLAESEVLLVMVLYSLVDVHGSASPSKSDSSYGVSGTSLSTSSFLQKKSMDSKDKVKVKVKDGLNENNYWISERGKQI
ncbi:hypothetical protein LXL04_007258 [Taraxacum kok-saghyz]